MALRIYQVTITGTQPLIMHNDDIEWADQMDAWRADKDNAKVSKAGDDRSPAFRWIGCLYQSEDKKVVVPAANIMRALMEGGAMVPVPGGRSGKTFKAQSQSGIMPRAVGWPLLIGGKEIPTAPVMALQRETEFAKHVDAVKGMGFSLFVKRARIGQKKHVRVRPRFEQWSIAAELTVSDDQIKTEILVDILEMAGTYKGLCDWRPGSKTPGSFGMFRADVKQVR